MKRTLATVAAVLGLLPGYAASAQTTIPHRALREAPAGTLFGLSPHEIGDRLGLGATSPLRLSEARLEGGVQIWVMATPDLVAGRSGCPGELPNVRILVTSFGPSRNGAPVFVFRNARLAEIRQGTPARLLAPEDVLQSDCFAATQPTGQVLLGLFVLPAVPVLAPGLMRARQAREEFGRLRLGRPLPEAAYLDRPPPGVEVANRRGQDATLRFRLNERSVTAEVQGGVVTALIAGGGPLQAGCIFSAEGAMDCS